MYKVGIMTWFQYHNYGTALQVTAMFEILKKMGCFPTVIQYYTKSCVAERVHDESYFRDILHKIKHKLKSVSKSQYSSMKRENKFDKFLLNRLQFTDKCETLSELKTLNDKFDYFVCGSDQIWAPSCYDSHYFLDFVTDSRKKIAYAPSIGLSKIENDEIKKEMAKLCSLFAHISTREKSGSKIIHNITGKKVETVLDPTLLLRKNDWRKFESKSIKLPKHPYLLVYMLGQNKRHWQEIHRIAKKLKLDVKIIPVFRIDFSRNGCIKFPIGPTEFLSLISSASFVCTDSFHGMAFSINYGKQFVVFERFSQKDPINQNSRIYNLIELLNLESRLMHPSDICKIEDIPKVDFSECYEKLDKLRKEPLDYLRSALHGSTKYNYKENKDGKG